MKKLATLLVLSLSLAGCASGKALATGIVAASDATADSLADSWQAATAARVAECRAKSLMSAHDRELCMGEFAPGETDKVIAAVQALVVVQLAVKAAAECETFNACIEKTDWAGLAQQAKAAWDAIVPYVRVVKGMNK